ncbi:MAG: hypothetical protein JW876_09330 [Candidatus Krumholzibacteriota bacterium]|nr:hypothetical protein [Candidatus Krumholzibacteriota bacterium]
MVECRERHVASALVALAVSCLILPSLVPAPALAGNARRIGGTLRFEYYLFDGGFFKLDDAPGLAASFRYELKDNVFFENRLGAIRTSQDGLSVNVLSYQFGMTAILPYFIPWRPLVRGGLAFLTADPVTVTPIDTFRPAQTTVYLVAGAGVVRSFKEDFAAELAVDAMITPYKYRVYSFDRQRVEDDPRQFFHLGISLGVSYVF